MYLPHLGHEPRIPEDIYVDPSARINGDVELGEESSVWFQVAIRGDVNAIRVGKRTNIQDMTVFHTAHLTHPTIVGDDVTFGHCVLAHGCRIGNRVLVGMSSTLMDGCEIGDDVIIGAGSLVTEGKKIPSGVLAFGRPAKVIRPLTDEERQAIVERAHHYCRIAEAYREAGQWYGWKDNIYRQMAVNR
jgi:carbonic anhydrase/acetyltransferase-like protein (isoleucine patch superfamily)